MFDIGFWEMSLIALIALMVLGPERLPSAARTVGLWVGRARRMVADVKSDINREIKDGELKELEALKKSVQKTSEEFTSSVSSAADSAQREAEKLDPKNVVETLTDSTTEAKNGKYRFRTRFD